MKKVGSCLNCGRNMYTNNLDLCKRCHQEVGLEFLSKIEEEPEEEEKGPSLEDLGIEPSAEESTQEASKIIEEPKEEKK